MKLKSDLLFPLALLAFVSLAQAESTPPGPPRTATVNTSPRLDVAAMTRPIEKTIANGLRMVQFRTDVTVAAIRNSMAAKGAHP